MEQEEKFIEGPFFKIAVFIVAMFFLFSALFYVQGILVPVLFAALLAMLVLPLCKFLERRISLGFSILISILVIFIVITGLLFLTYTQIASLMDDFELIRAKALEKFTDLQSFIDAQFDISASKQMDWITGNYDKAISVGGNFLKGFLIGFSGWLANFLLVIIYVFFFLLFRHRIKTFLMKLFSRDEHSKVADVVNKIQSLTIHYMTGLLLEVLILGALNSVGFLILGIKQAIFFGYLGAILNLIPYIGAFIGAILPIFVAFIYKDSSLYPLGVLGVVFVTQFIDNNFLTPKIVGSHIRVNELATILVIIIGGSLWGLSGMILFLPLLGIMKIVCDNVSALNPIGYLIGEDKKEAEVQGKEGIMGDKITENKTGYSPS